MRQSAEFTLTPPVSKRDHAVGLSDAPVTLVEYGDFECGDTIRAYSYVKSIRRQVGDTVRFVFRHYPLVDSHPRAKSAAVAAEAAGAQGKFWEMHDRLFEHPYALGRDDLIRHARDLGLDLARFETDLAGPKLSARVDEDRASGVASKVRGTPTFYINGQRYTGSEDEEGLLGAVQDALDV